MARCTSPLLLLLLLAATIAACVRAADPNCSKGIKMGVACCPKACGKCGGNGCGRRGRRNGIPGQCCVGPIKRTARSCNKANPPCKVQRRKKRGRNGRGKSPESAPSPKIPALPRSNTGGGGGGGGGRVSADGRWSIVDNSLRESRQGKQVRHEACFVMVRGKAYLLGGRGTRTLSAFDPVSRTWEDHGNMKYKMHHMQCVAVGRKIYVASSWFGNSPREENHASVFVYDTQTRRWALEPGMPRERRRGGAGAVYYNGKIYVVGGNRGGHGPPSKTLGYFDAYDVRRKQWDPPLPDVPEGRDHTAAAMVRGRLCIAGGRDGGKKSFFKETVKSVYCFNFSTRQWEREQDIPTPRGGVAAATTCSGDMMVVGGETGRKLAYSTVEVFNGKTWRSVASLNVGRHGSGLAVSDCSCGHIFIASGSGNRGGKPELTSTEVFVPSGQPNQCSKY